jgi:hypothetical protein
MKQPGFNTISIASDSYRTGLTAHSVNSHSRPLGEKKKWRKKRTGELSIQVKEPDSANLTIIKNTYVSNIGFLYMIISQKPWQKPISKEELSEFHPS